MVKAAADEIATPPLQFDPPTALAYHFVQAAPVETTVSAGIVLDRKPGRELDTLFASADELLYRAKTGGRNRFELRVLSADGEARADATLGSAPHAVTLAPA
jgi:predicted signal transduction protein with EAL and GGDEF domain